MALNIGIVNNQQGVRYKVWTVLYYFGPIDWYSFCRHCSSLVDKVHNPSWTDCAAVGD